MLKTLLAFFTPTGTQQAKPIVQSDQDALLRTATARKTAGEFTTAIELLRQAYRDIARLPTEYPVETFLRLPLYLQKAGRSDEAWQEFRALLEHGYPNQPYSKQLIAMDHSTIYDKMRLFLQREGKADLAVSYGICSYLSWAVGLHRQRRRNELKEYIDRENIRENVERLLKKTTKKHLNEMLSDIINEQLRSLPEIDFERIQKQIEGIVDSN